MGKLFTALGLMSGTSGDGVDASIISSDGINQYKEIKNKYFKYDQKIFENLHYLRNKILKSDDLKINQREITNLEREITLFHAKVVHEILDLSNERIDFVGFHGQTIYHNPKEKISKQIGDGNLLSQLIKKKVIFNFRKNDISNGGEGAPLTPIFHKFILKTKKIKLPACILNIGGISNITFLNDFDNHNILSKDLGPGNCLIDSWIQAHTSKKFDNNGEIASRGKINEVILEQALETHENNFKKKNNLSYDISDFDISFARGLSLEDGAATLTSFSAKLISSSIISFLKDHYNKEIIVIVCGGGRKNKNLINQIKSNLSKNILIKNSESLGFNGDFIESQAFGYLAIRSVLSLPITFPNTTGCKRACTGGEIINF